ncbi:MAG: 4-fold beta flower protein [Aeromicrobium sp.]|uniref:4-fold beta flower protein n=1 Tax=Aeromicrobium sp. TaxID=1871063 RepID=UPI003C6244B9
MSVYLFDMEGGAIAFRRTWSDPYVFDLDGHWIGHCAWDDNDVFDLSGRYLGSVVSDRLVRRNDWDGRPSRTTADDPGPVTRSGTPGTPLSFPNCFAYEDVSINHAV